MKQVLAFLVMVILSFVALGFLGSEYINTYKALNNAQQEIASLKSSNQELSLQLTQTEQIVQNQENELQSLQLQVVNLQNLVNVEKQKSEEYEKQNQLLALCNPALQQTEKQNESQNNTIEATDAGNLIQDASRAKLLIGLIILPSLAISLPLILKVNRKNSRQTRPPVPNSYVLLTDMEIREVIRRRKSDARN